MASPGGRLSIMCCVYFKLTVILNYRKIKFLLCCQVSVPCGLCDLKPQLSNLRTHTKKAHGMAIGEYREKFTVKISESVFHR